MAPRRSPAPAVAVVILLLLGSGCSGAPEPQTPAAGAVAQEPDPAGPGTGAVAIALRAAGEPLPDVVGKAVDDARRVLGTRGVQTQVVAFDADAAVTAQSPRGGEAPPADGTVTLWQGTPPDLPPSAPPPAPATAAPAPPAVPEPPAPEDGPVAEEPPVPDDADAEPEPPAALAEAVAAAGTAEAAAAPAREPSRAPSEPTSRSRPTGTLLEGPATWYGPGFVGNPTACGGRFDPNELTMASRELPCGTRARVTAASGRSVEVTVTDWGPAEWTGKRFDLSAAAFAEIASLSAGVIRVRVEVLR